MPFIKIISRVINTDYIAAVELAGILPDSTERIVSILLASSTEPPLEFEGEEAALLLTYFTDDKNVIDLLPQPEENPITPNVRFPSPNREPAQQQHPSMPSELPEVPIAMLDYKDFRGRAMVTNQVIDVIYLAAAEARRLQQNFIGTNQLLLGLIAQDRGIAARALKALGVNLASARQEVEKMTNIASVVVVDELPFTPRVETALEGAFDAAWQTGCNEVDTEHLLISLLREVDSITIRLLENLGCDRDSLSANIRLLMDE